MKMKQGRFRQRHTPCLWWWSANQKTHTPHLPAEQTLLLPWKSGLGDAVPTWLTSRCLWLESGSKWKPCPWYMVDGEDTSWHPKRKWQKANPNLSCHLPSYISRDYAHSVKVEAIMYLSKTTATKKDNIRISLWSWGRPKLVFKELTMKEKIW